MTADLYVVPDDAVPDGLPLDEWNQVVDHVRACFPYSRPWSVETQQAFYEALCRFDYTELIGAASRLAQSTRRRDPRERPSLAEFREAAQSERAAQMRDREEVRLRVAEQPWRGWEHMEMEPPGEEAGPYYRLAYAISTGVVAPSDRTAHDRFLRENGLILG